MKVNYYLITSALFGLLFFYLCGGMNTLDVTNIGYLMSGDPAQHWLGWEFFRHTPLIQWPLGKNTDYGIELNNSIVYTDSIPIFAIFFKLISAILPETFQYTGIWILSCFVLQGVTSFLLVKKLTNNNVYSLILSALFISAVPFLTRTGGHFALSAQWIIIASYLLYACDRFKSKSWIILLFIASWVHAYLLAMALVIYIADLATRKLKGEFPLKAVIYHVILSGIILYISMYSIGYFTISNSFSADGYGFYKFNLNSFFNPYYPPYSSIIKPMPAGAGDYEGLNYLGIGVILAIALIVAKIKSADVRFKETLKNNKTIVLLVSLCLIYAVSVNVDLGKTTILAFYLPDFLRGITNTFRATGRFGWLAFYGILIFTAISLSRIYKGRQLIVASLILVSLNIYDVHKIYKEREKTFSNKNATYIMDSPEIKYIAKNYKKILTPSPWDFSSEYVKWAYLASTNNMSMNFGYFARFNGDTWNKQTEEILQAVNNVDLDKDAIYLLKDKNQYDKIVNILGDKAINFSYGNAYIVGIKK